MSDHLIYHHIKKLDDQNNQLVKLSKIKDQNWTIKNGGIKIRGVQIQTDPKKPKTAKTEYFWMCLDVVLEKLL